METDALSSAISDMAGGLCRSALPEDGANCGTPSDLESEGQILNEVALKVILVLRASERSKVASFELTYFLENYCPKPHEFLLLDIETREVNLQKLEAEANHRDLSLSKLLSAASELDKRKKGLTTEIRMSEETLMKKGLKSILGSLKDLEQCEADFFSSCRKQCLTMEEALLDIEKGISERDKNNSDGSFLDRSIADAQDKLDNAKRALGAKRRAILSLQKQLGDVPVRSELIQYEYQFSGLKLQIEEKLQQTRQYYDTYNALLEMKELTMKELSLLNSINSQFEEAVLDSSARLKLMNSQEAILKGIQQKLKKMESALLEEQRIRDSFEDKYSAAVAEHRRFSSLLKALQEERARNERLRALIPQ